MKIHKRKFRNKEKQKKLEFFVFWFICGVILVFTTAFFFRDANKNVIEKYIFVKEEDGEYIIIDHKDLPDDIVRSIQ